MPSNNRGRALGPISTEAADRFFTYVKKSDGCWLWQGGHLKSGYGNFKLASYTMRLAHRVAYAIAYGPVPQGVNVLHHCDNPPCVRPDHLFLGTDADNVADMLAKGRHYASTHPEKALRGERHPRTPLTWTQVCEIRERYASGAGSLSSLGREFAVTPQAIRAIVTGQSWKTPL